jgi:hypothetical protein
MTKSKLLRLFKEIKHDGAVVALYDTYSVKKSELELVVADSNKLETVDPSTRVVKELFMEDIIRMFENAQQINSNIMLEEYGEELSITFRDLYDKLTAKKFESLLMGITVEESKKLHDEYFEANKERIEEVHQKRIDELMAMYREMYRAFDSQVNRFK